MNSEKLSAPTGFSSGFCKFKNRVYRSHMGSKSQLNYIFTSESSPEFSPRSSSAGAEELTAGVPISAERRLLAALLTDGVEHYLDSYGNGSCRAEQNLSQRLPQSQNQQNELEEARRWIESTDDTYIFSFEMVCRGLGLDPNYVRRGLQGCATKLEQTRPNRQPAAENHQSSRHGAFASSHAVGPHAVQEELFAGVMQAEKPQPRPRAYKRVRRTF